jgi:hypothetical protein
MLLCELNPTYQQESQQCSDVDWEAAANNLPHHYCTRVQIGSGVKV